MKMICDRTLLSNAVAGVSKAVTQRSSIPVLEGILMKAEGFSLTLTGYDLEMGITTSIEANVLEPGEVVLSAKLLGDMVRGQNDPAAALDTLGGEALLKRLAGIFLGEEPNIRANLQRFALSPETLPELCPELRRQAHSLKNGAGMLHLESLRKASSDLEQAAASPAGQDFAALLRTTIEALERASAALRKHCGA